jgi:hypothetical protein
MPTVSTRCPAVQSEWTHPPHHYSLRGWVPPLNTPPALFPAEACCAPPPSPRSHTANSNYACIATCHGRATRVNKKQQDRSHSKEEQERDLGIMPQGQERPVPAAWCASVHALLNKTLPQPMRHCLECHTQHCNCVAACRCAQLYADNRYAETCKRAWCGLRPTQQGLPTSPTDGGTPQQSFEPP